MDKALPSGGKDSEFESWGGRDFFHFYKKYLQREEQLTSLRKYPFFDTVDGKHWIEELILPR